MKTLIMSKSPDGKVAFLTGGAAVSAAPASGEVEGVTFLLRFAVCRKPDRCSIAVIVRVVKFCNVVIASQYVGDEFNSVVHDSTLFPCHARYFSLLPFTF